MNPSPADERESATLKAIQAMRTISRKEAGLSDPMRVSSGTEQVRLPMLLEIAKDENFEPKVCRSTSWSVPLPPMSPSFRPLIRGQRLLPLVHPNLTITQDRPATRRKRCKRRERRRLGPDETARMADACEILGLSEGTIRNRMNPQSRYFDPEFPVWKPLGKVGIRCAKGWRAGNLYAYRDEPRTAV